MALDTLEKLTKGLKNGDKFYFYKVSAGSQLGGAMSTLWRVSGLPVIGILPSTPAYCDKTTLGGINFNSIPLNEKMYIGQINATNTFLGQLIVFDRLSHMGGLSSIVTTSQAVNLDIIGPASQGRCEEDGSGVLWCLDVYVSLGATATNVEIVYTNENNVGERITEVVLPVSTAAHRSFPIMPNDNDKRIKSIQSVRFLTSTGTAGNTAVVARRRVAEIAIDKFNQMCVADYASLALPEIIGTECLELYQICSNVSATGNLAGSITFITA